MQESVRSRVLRDFAPDEHVNEQDTLSREEIAAFLARSKDTDSSLLTTIKRRAARQNRPPRLSSNDYATLDWICEAFADWEENYPLEAPMRDQLHRLLPLAVAMALFDEDFFIPGAHPLHRLLDELQRGAVGWQRRLERAGQMLEQRVERAVEKALEWFNDKRVDVGAIADDLIAANERDAARAQRMVQRLAETEGARMKTLAAQREAAEEINLGLTAHELPVAIGEFLKGPWFDSAQMVLVRHGSRSEAWADMKRTARQLMESVQRPDEKDGHRDRQDQVLRKMPGELRRWLLSIEHDSDATDSAIGLVEYVHLRLQHGQRLQLVNIDPIKLEDDDAPLPCVDREDYANGDWYLLHDDEGPLRAQLVLQLEDSQHMLFANCVGLKALDLPRGSFMQRLGEGQATPLATQSSFSLSLAAAAGVNDDTTDASRDAAIAPGDGQIKARASVSVDSDTQSRDGESANELDEPHAYGRQAAADAELTYPSPAGLRTPQDPVHSEPLELELDEGESQPPAAPTLMPAAPTVNPQPRFEAAPADADDDVGLDLPMGVWLGFHDGDTPIMAKLAVYDPRRGFYIFVNRKGIAMREMSRRELVELVDQGLVDILETRCAFRDEVRRARERDE